MGHDLGLDFGDETPDIHKSMHQHGLITSLQPAGSQVYRHIIVRQHDLSGFRPVTHNSGPRLIRSWTGIAIRGCGL
jgi:hypothetical protein